MLDTNVIIGLYEHNPIILEWLHSKSIKVYACAFSAITRIELLSYPDLTAKNKSDIETLLNRMTYLALTVEIENETIAFRCLHQTKLPDAIIAATAKHFRIELLTLDKKLANKL